MDEKKFRKLTLPSTFEEIERLDPYLLELQEWADIDEELYSKIRLAVNEAVTNAVIHGNEENAAKKVHIDTKMVDNFLQVHVKDEGPGFDPSALPDPLEEENLLNQSGRGLFLIKQYTDRLEFADGASHLILYFALD